VVLKLRANSGRRLWRVWCYIPGDCRWETGERKECLTRNPQPKEDGEPRREEGPISRVSEEGGVGQRRNPPRSLALKFVTMWDFY